MRIVDTHLHLIYLDQFTYEWLAGEPRLNRQWDAPSYFAEAEALGIEAALHMEVDVPERQIDDENRFVLSVDPRVVGAISNARPENIDFPEHLERLRRRGLAGKRALALREFALGIEALDRFVRREPLRRVHECVFGVLALESEPVDPRL